MGQKIMKFLWLISTFVLLCASYAQNSTVSPDETTAWRSTSEDRGVTDQFTEDVINEEPEELTINTSPNNTTKRKFKGRNVPMPVPVRAQKYFAMKVSKALVIYYR